MLSCALFEGQVVQRTMKYFRTFLFFSGKCSTKMLINVVILIKFWEKKNGYRNFNESEMTPTVTETHMGRFSPLELELRFRKEKNG